MNLGNIDAFIEKFGGLTEEYKFYNGEVTLRYDPKDHIYLLVTPEGLVRQDGVTTVCHILDKSNVLIPWACKMMAQKLKSSYNFDIITDPQTELHTTYELLGKRIDEAKSAHKDKLEDAGQVGHLAHGWIESYIKAVLSENQPRVEELLAKLPDEDRTRHSCVAALEWMSKHNVRWLGTEQKIYSRQHCYAGTMDGRCLADSCDNPECCPVQFKDRLTIADWKTSNYLYIEYVLQTSAYKYAYEEETGENIQDIWVIRLGKDDAEFEAWHIEGELQALGWKAFHSALYLSRDVEDVRQAVADIKDTRKAKKRAEDRVEKEEALKVKCKNADRYKGIRYPVCNGGNPCQTCLAKHAQRSKEFDESVQKLLDK